MMNINKHLSSIMATLSLNAITRKKYLTSAVVVFVGSFTASAHADLSNGSLGLQVVGNLTPTCLIGGTYPGCDFGAFDTTEAGSFFDMGGSPAAAVDGNAPIMLNGSSQTHNTSDVGGGVAYPGDNRSIFLKDWDFFNAIGTNGHSGITVSNNDSEIDMGTWFVTWSEVPVIDMGGGPSDTGIAALVCTGGIDPNACEEGESFTLDYAATVPPGDPSGFGGTLYELHLQGTVVSTNDAPVAASNPLLAVVTPNGTAMIDLASNVSDADGTIDNTSFQFTYTGSRIPAPTIVDNGSGVFSYTDNAGTDTIAADTFTYSVADNLGDRSADFTVEMSVIAGDPAPVAQSFAVGTDKDIAAVVDVIANVTDSGGSVDATTVVTSNPVSGAVTNIDAITGAVTFTPGAGFTGVASFDYAVDDDAGGTSNVATVTVNVNDPPVAGDSTVSVDRNSSVDVDVVLLATDSDGTVDAATVVASQGANGTTSVDIGNGKVTYTPTTPGLIGADSFTYTVNDDKGTVSNTGTISVNIVNALPVAVDDITSVNTSINASVDIDVVSNDTDADGTVDPTTVAVTVNPTNGNTTVNTTTGAITYTPTSGFVGSDTFEYTIDDNDAGTSTAATVTISVSDGSSFCDKAPLATETCFLQFVPGNIAENTLPVLGDGSYFGMEVQPGAPTITPVVAFNSFQLNVAQLGGPAPQNPNIDKTWKFFGNLGIHQTTKAVTVLTDDGAGNVTLDMSGWNVSWNAIPSINLGEGADNGIGTLTCFSDDVVTQTQGDCSAGDAFVLDYRATVPKGDPSNFGGVKYNLHLEGVIAKAGVVFSPVVAPNTTDIQAIDSAGGSVSVQSGDVAVAASSATGTGLSAADVGVVDPLLNPDDGAQCYGGCVDFVVTGITGDFVDIIYLTSVDLVNGAVYRKLMNGVWGNFDESVQDQIGSNAAIAGVCTDDQFAPGLRAGNRCIFMRIYDGGPNDADGVKNGTIVDPSGVLLPGSPNTPSSSTSGCSISSTPVALRDRTDWVIVALFLGLLGLHRLRRKRIS